MPLLSTGAFLMTYPLVFLVLRSHTVISSMGGLQGSLDGHQPSALPRDGSWLQLLSCLAEERVHCPGHGPFSFVLVLQSLCQCCEATSVGAATLALSLLQGHFRTLSCLGRDSCHGRCHGGRQKLWGLITGSASPITSSASLAASHFKRP